MTTYQRDLLDKLTSSPHSASLFELYGHSSLDTATAAHRLVEQGLIERDPASDDRYGGYRFRPTKHGYLTLGKPIPPPPGKRGRVPVMGNGTGKRRAS